MDEQIEKPVNLIQSVRDKIGSEVMSDCFVALCLSTLRQWLLSSDSKYFIFSDMFGILKEKGYTDEQIQDIKAAMQLIIEKYNTYNEFMG